LAVSPPVHAYCRSLAGKVMTAETTNVPTPLSQQSASDTAAKQSQPFPGQAPGFKSRSTKTHRFAISSCFCIRMDPSGKGCHSSMENLVNCEFYNILFERSHMCFAVVIPALNCILLHRVRPWAAKTASGPREYAPTTTRQDASAYGVFSNT
jgi:hypothetical protein